MESKIFGRSIVVELKDADKTREIIETFVNVGAVTIERESHSDNYAEFVIGNCDEGTFRGIISDIMVEVIQLY